MTNRKIFSVLLRCMVSIFVVYVVLRIVGLRNIMEIFTVFQARYLIVIFLLLFMVYFIFILNSYLFFSRISNVKFWDFAKTYFMVYFMSDFTPARVGDFSLAFLLKKHNVRYRVGFAIILLDKGINFAIWCALLLVSFLIVNQGVDLWWFFDPTDKFFLLLVLATMLAILLLAWWLMHRKFSSYLTQARSFLVKHYRIVILNSFLTIIKILLNVLAVVVIFASFQQHTSYFNVLFSNSIVSVAGILPVSFNSLGIREAVYYLFYPIVGIDGALAVAVSLVIPVISALAKLIVVICYFVFYSFKKLYGKF